MKDGRSIKFIVQIVVMAVLTAVFVTANILASVFSHAITLALNGSGADYSSLEAQEAYNHGAEVGQKIAEEGVVLLKNENNALPLANADKVNVFGWASTAVFYGGSGSGTSNSTSAKTFSEVLDDVGLQTNPVLTKKYKDFKSAREKSDVGSASWALPEPALSAYSSQDWADYLSYSDIAIMVIARNGGEGNDLPSGYLTITDTEKQLLQVLESTFNKVIVIINAGNAMELGFLDDEGIDAALNIGFLGSHGLIGLANIIKGNVSPSGRLVDTFAYDSTSAPTYAKTNIDNCTTGVYQYANKSGYFYVDYNEGIYVGYRYYETRFADGSSSKDTQSDYGEVVQYPFGYGLSYTDFKWEIVSASPKDGSVVNGNDKISIDVKVKNVGNTSGKEVVQCYYTAPYYNGEIEKSYVVLSAFAKTKELRPNETDTVTLEFNVEDMASYDYNDANGDNFCGYTLDKGDYQIRIMKDCHNYNGSDEEFTLVYKIENTINLNKRSHDKTEVENLFTGVQAENGISIDGSQEAQPVKYLSRADWNGTWPIQSASRNMTQEVMNSISYKIVNNDDDEMPITETDYGLVLEDLKGLDYDDPMWELLLDQMSVSEMAELISKAGYVTAKINSIGKNKTIDLDGPAGINESNTTIMTDTSHAVAYPSETVIAQTWNIRCAYEMGEAVGAEARAYGINGWYAPAVNLHRSPYSGRNFEYYSEDALISGKMGAQVVNGTNSMGLYACVKHFAVNDQETKRDANGLFTWVTEQAVRELYLLPFEMTVKEGNAVAVMSSFNRLGATWTGGSYSLLTTILRKEWGYCGFVITDWYYPGNYMNVDQGLRAGNDAWLNGLGTDVNFDSKSATSVIALRNASHNILYTIGNADIQSQEVEATWVTWLIVADCVFVAGLGVWLFFRIRGIKKNFSDNRKS